MHGTKLAWIQAQSHHAPKLLTFYFALSAKSSLEQAPFNYPTIVLRKDSPQAVIYSTDLPWHAYGQNEQHTVKKWIRELGKGSSFLEEFLQDACEDILHIYQDISSHTQASPVICLMGLSRGAFIAAHLLSRLQDKFDRSRQLPPFYLVAYAPLSTLKTEEDQALDKNWSLTQLPYKNFESWMSIGNNDQRVQSSLAFASHQHFVQETLKFQRQAAHNFFTYPSVGHLGHGTPNEVFELGIKWLLSRI